MYTDTWFDHITELPPGLEGPKTKSWSRPRPADHTLEGDNCFGHSTAYSDGTVVETSIVIPCVDYKRLAEIGGFSLEEASVHRLVHAIGRCKVLRDYYARTMKYKRVWSGTPEEFLDETSDNADNDGEEWKTP